MDIVQLLAFEVHLVVFSDLLNAALGIATEIQELVIEQVCSGCSLFGLID